MLSSLFTLVGDGEQNRRCHGAKAGGFHHGGLAIIDGQQHAADTSKVNSLTGRNRHSCGCLGVLLVPLPLRLNRILLGALGISKVTGPADVSCGNVPVCVGSSHHLDNQLVALSNLNSQLQAVVVNAVSQQSLLCVGVHVGNNDITGHTLSDAIDVQRDSAVSRSSVGVVVAVVVALFQSSFAEVPAQLFQNLRIHLRANRICDLQSDFLCSLGVIGDSEHSRHTGVAFHQDSLAAVNAQEHAADAISSIVSSAYRDIR